MYTYKIYNVGVASEFKLYDLQEEKCEAEITISRISEGLDEEEYERKHINYKILSNGVWFMNQCGQFYVLDGRRIEIMPKETATDLVLSTFITGWCMGFLFYQRNYSVFHCTALEMNGGCVLVSGGSGAGKSTTAMKLIERGYRYLADDMAIVTPENGYMVAPAFPVQKMCRNVAETLDDSSMLYVDADKDKFARTNLQDFCTESRKLKLIVLLKLARVDEVKVKELDGIDKFKALTGASFLDGMHAGPNVPPEEGFRILRIAGACRVISIARPVEGDTLTQICDIIEAESRK